MGDGIAISKNKISGDVMPKINVVINEKKNIKNFIKNGAHGIIIGCEGFSNIKPLNLTLDEISVITKDVHEYNGKYMICQNYP